MGRIILVLLISFFSLVGRIDAQELRGLMKPGNGRRVRGEREEGNRLAREKSPYLQQHAHNPIDWYPWGEEAFSRAREEDKPVFLSIGYSTCHWCHVMAHESFENQEVADFLNHYFISIKVDREELPGIDRIYMAATQAMTGSGGWPMSLFLFPDTRPFYGGTYFPLRSGYDRPGFVELLQLIHKAWLEDRKKLTLSAEQVTAYLQEKSPDSSQSLSAAWLEKGFSLLRDSYDPRYGGFGQAPKFPRPVVMDFLFQFYHAAGEEKARAMALYTMERMATGGIYDHVGGGFHRYSVDGRWRVPHFEKMLYDQAQLASLYLSAFQISGNSRFAKTAGEILDYVLRVMQDPGGGFYSAEDADSVNPYNPSEHGEGAYYLWTEEEIDSLLSEEEAPLFKEFHGVEKEGNVLQDPQKEFVGRNILYQAKEMEEATAWGRVGEGEVEELLQRGRTKLLSRRNRRRKPHLDDKIITAWNGLMISAFARASVILEEERYLSAAERGAAFVLEELIVEGKLKRRWRAGEARHAAGLEDYAFLIQGLLDLYRASHVPSWLHQAMELTEEQIALFSDARGGFYDTPQGAELLTRMQTAYDGAEPSGNSVAALNLLRLGGLTGKKQWSELGRKTIEAFGKTLEAYPPAMPLMLVAMDFQLSNPRQIVIVGEPNGEDTKALLREVHRRYLPHTMLILADGMENQDFLEQGLPFLKNVSKVEGRATAYVCVDFSCKVPVQTREALAGLLDETTDR